MSVGDGSATEIDVTGPKGYYMLGGTSNETAKFDAINLVQVGGHFGGERTSPFESESSDTAGTATKSVVETLDVEFFYSASLVVINYPAWSGNGIVHDPDYSVQYQPRVQEETSETTSEPTPETTSTNPISKPTTQVSDQAPTDGFGVVFSILGLTFIAIIIPRKFRK